METVWFHSLVWLDYRLAVVFAVILPIILLIWSLLTKTESIVTLLVIYWRVASLLMISAYLMIASWPIAFITGTLAKILIPVSLWFWKDLNEEIRDLPDRLLKLLTTAWRWALTFYFGLGTLFSLPFVSCTFNDSLMNNQFCQVWLEAPWKYKEIFHAGSKPDFLGFLALVGLVFYLLYLGNFIFFRLSKKGRSALEQ